MAFKVGRFADQLPQASRAGVVASAVHVKRSVQAFVGPATGGDFRLSGVGRRGAKVNVRFDNPVGKLEPAVLVRMVGPAHLIENPTKPHRIPNPRRRRGRRRVVSIPGVGVRAYANHPGTRGRKPWAKGVAVAKPKLRGIYSAAVVDTMRKSFR